MRNHNKQDQTGFTLVELLLALAIFAYAATSIMKLVGQSAKNLNQLEEMTFASWVVNNRLAELQVSPVWPPKNKDKGEVEMAGQIWYWLQEVEKTEDARLRAVTVKVATDKDMERPVYSLLTYVSEYKLTKDP